MQKSSYQLKKKRKRKKIRNQKRIRRKKSIRKSIKSISLKKPTKKEICWMNNKKMEEILVAQIKIFLESRKSVPFYFLWNHGHNKNLFLHS